MMRWKCGKRYFKAVIFSAFFLLALPSCAPVLFVGGAVVGAGAYSYVTGEASTSERATVEEAYRAAMAALKKLKLEVLSSTYDAFSGKIEAERTDDDTVLIKFKRENMNLTQISVRAGIFSDREDAQAVLNAILTEINS